MIIGFSRTKGSLLSYLIRKCTNSRWSHCFLVNDVGCVMEATALKGVEYSPFTIYKNNPKKIYELWEIPELGNDYKSIMDLFGMPYGLTQIIANLLARAAKSEWLVYTKHVVCSELVTIFLKRSKIGYYFKDLKPNYVSPEDVYRKVTNHPSARMIGFKK